MPPSPDLGLARIAQEPYKDAKTPHNHSHSFSPGAGNQYPINFLIGLPILFPTSDY
jgi:hypothetical protein